MNQISVMSMMKSIVPITRFNKGEVTKIFEEVEATGVYQLVIQGNVMKIIVISV